MSADGRWQAYPEYKDSGVAWLGEIPAHWETASLKYVVRLEYGDSLPSDAREEGNVVVFGSNGPVGTHSEPNTLAPVIIVGRKGSYGKVNLSDSPAFAIDTTYYADSRSTKANLRWLFYVLQMVGLEFSQDSAVPGLSREFAYQKRLPVIPLFEQRAIAAFLDRETAKIDTLIAKQERLIKLLREKRAALISHAVTKGLDPGVEMKDSGIPWLGEIPRGWVAGKLKQFAAIIDGDRGKEYPNESDLTDEGIPFLSSKNIVNDKLDYLDLRFITAEKFNRLGRGKLTKGDLIITVRGTIGSICQFSGEEFETAFINAQMMILRPIEELMSAFLHYVALSEYWLSQLACSSYGTAQQQLSNKILSNLRIAIPTQAGQKAIIAHLDCETAKIDALIAKVQKMIERLQEYRTALISAAVTGKMDVRES